MTKKKWVKHRPKHRRYKKRTYWQRHIRGKRGSRRKHYSMGASGKNKTWNVSIAGPYYKDKLAWTATTNFDMLSADTLAKLGGSDVSIERIEAPTQKEAIEEYKKLHPEFKKHFKEMDEEDVELSL